MARAEKTFRGELMMRFRPLAIATLAAIASATISVAAPAPPTTQAASVPMYVEVYVHGDKRDQKVAGKLGEHDDTHLVIDAPGGARDLTWDQLTPSSAFTLKSRLVDKTSAADWLTLGTWGWEHGLEQQSKTALSTARKLDATLASQIDAVLATKSGSKSLAAATPTTAPTAAKPGVKTDTGTADAGSDDSAAAASSDDDEVAKLTPAFKRGQKIHHYTTPTTDEIGKSLERSRKFAAKVKSLTKTELAELETAHFLIYTDWDPREYGFLKDKCEGAYKVLAHQFNVSPNDNVFVGKLPIYMFVKPKTFQQFSEKLDGFRAPATVLGYFIPSDEIGHMAMWKPGIGQGIGAGGSLSEAERNWARTLVHEFSHAFINRYKSDGHIPRWMNEGLAEVISEAELPTNNYHAHAREIAMHDIDVTGLFEDRNMPTGAAYPVMMTMVECLLKEDGKKFVAMVNAIKDGADPEDALEKQYGVRYDRFAEGWMKYARSLK